MIKAVHEDKGHIPLSFLCRHFGVSRSGFYKWLYPENTSRLHTKKEICEAIENFFVESKGSYGSPRIWDDLVTSGFKVSENTVAKYMKELGLDARLKKKYRVQTTDSNHSNPIAPRLFQVKEENTLPTSPGEVLAGDITYLKLGKNTFLYLAVVLDIYTREVVGWSISRSLEKQIVLDALDMSLNKVGPRADIIFHSDRGSQYASDAFRKFAANHKLKLSMSRRGNCYDNAYVESWFSSLKKEWIYRASYNTEAELRSLVFEYIEIWYNKRRKHSSLGNLSPEKYRKKHQARS